MGPCAQYSTFAGSAVFLTHDGKFCDVDAKKQLYCDGSKGLFTFEHTETGDSCTGSAELKSLKSGQPLACSFDPSSPSPYVACGGPTVSGAPTEIVISTNPLPTSRSGNVGFEFKGMTGSPFWPKKLAIPFDKPTWGYGIQGFTRETMVMNAPGGFCIMQYRWAYTASSSMDMAFRSKAYPNTQGFGLGQTPPRTVGGPTGERRKIYEGPPLILCPKHSILTYVESTSQPNWGYRVWTWKCSPLPKGWEISGTWQAWPKYATGESGWPYQRQYVIGMAGSICPGYTVHGDYYTGTLGKSFGTQYFKGQTKFISGYLSFTKPSPMVLDVQYSSVLP